MVLAGAEDSIAQSASERFHRVPGPMVCAAVADRMLMVGRPTPVRRLERLHSITTVSSVWIRDSTTAWLSGLNPQATQPDRLLLALVRIRDFCSAAAAPARAGTEASSARLPGGFTVRSVMGRV